MNTIHVPQRIKELIDVCRDGVDDPLSEEMQELGDWLKDNPEGRFILSRSLAFDQQVKAAIVDVPVPAGLADKICNFVEDNQAQVAAAPANDLGVQESSKESAKRSGRRRFLLVGGSAGVVVATLIGLIVYGFYFKPELEHVSALQLCADDGQKWLNAVDELDWNSVQGNEEFKALNQRLSECSDLVVAPARWASFRSRFGETAAYVSEMPGGKRVYQFTFHADVKKFAFSNVPQLLPKSPQYPGNRFCVAVCQKGDLVHVVVVEGNPTDYENMLKERYDFA